MVKENLLVFSVDDELGIRMGIQTILEAYSFTLSNLHREVEFTVETFGTGEDLLAALEDHTPHLCLLDCKLPGIGGLEILETVLSKRDDIVSIVITAYATLETAIKSTKMGAFDFLAKPFTPDEFRYTLRKAASHVVLKREALKLEEERKQIRFQFLSVLAHELKSPINAVEGYLDLLENKLLGNDIESYTAVVDKCMRRIGGMRKLIADLMDLTRLESGQKPREQEFLDLKALAERSLESVEVAAEKRGISLSLETHGLEPFLGDEGEMEIIFNNLISNAVKYNRDGGKVEVTITGTPEGAYTISVTDTGIGLTQEEQDKLFREFVRIKNKDTRNIPGSGLGLSIVKKLALMHGGDATVRSEKGVGSTFTVTLISHEHEA